MERKNYLIFVISILVFFSFDSKANYKEKIYQAFISNQMDVWKIYMDEMEKNKKENSTYLAELLNYQYGYIGWCMGVENKTDAKEYLKQAEKNLQLLEELNYNTSEINAYHSAFYGFKIGIAPIKAPFYGPKSMSHAEQSVELNPKNAFGYIQLGNVQYYMPPVFGGSKEIAIENFQKAEELMELNHESTQNNWNYLSVLTLIAQSFEKLEQWEKAKNYYEKALKTEPNYLWVKNNLYPELLKKMKNE